MKDLKGPSTKKDRVSSAVPQSEGEQATRDLLASAGIELLPEYAERAKKGLLAPMLVALSALLSRFSRKTKQEESKKSPLGTQEEETTLENVLASLDIGAPKSKAALVKAFLAKVPTACKAVLEKASAILAPLPKSVRVGGAVLILLLIAGIVFMTLRPGAQHGHHAVLAHRAASTSMHRAASTSMHRAASMKTHRAAGVHTHRVLHPARSVLVPEVTGSTSSAASYDRSAEAAIIKDVRRKISHLCGLQVSKVYRWKYREGYLFCYSQSDGYDTSAVLERGADGVFTLIGGTKGLMTYDEMTDTYLIDGEIARYLLE